MPKWTQETVWVARDDNGQILRASDTGPDELLVEAERLRQISNKGEERA